MPSAEVATSAFTRLSRSASSASLAVGVVEPAGVGAHLVAGVAQQRGRLLGRGDGERVDDAAARQVADVRGQPGQPGAVGRQPEHAEPQRVAGQRAADRRHRDPAGAELLGDVVDHPLVGGGGGGEHRRAGRAACPAGRGCAGSRAGSRGPSRRRSAPRRRRPARSGRPGRAAAPRGSAGWSAAPGETSRTSTSSAARRGGDVVPLGHVGAGDLDGADAGPGGRGDLVAHQREQRAHQQGRALAAAAQQRGGDEVDRRLAPAGALHDQRPLRALDQRRRPRRPAPRGTPRRDGRSARAGWRAPRQRGRRTAALRWSCAPTVGSAADEPDRPADLVDGGGRIHSDAIRSECDLPPDNHVHTHWSWDTAETVDDAPRLRAGRCSSGCRRSPSPSTWTSPSGTEDDRAHRRGPDRPAARPAAADRRRGLRRRARRVPRPLPRTCASCPASRPASRTCSRASIAAHLRAAPADRVLGSLHSLPRRTAASSASGGCSSRTPTATMRRYLGELVAMIESSDVFQVLAHVDFPRRYWPGGTAAVRGEGLTRRSTGRCSARWPRTGRALEVNTSSPLASVDQVRWFHEEGGEAVSFGSDAHQPAAVGQHFDVAVDVVEAAGFRPGRDRLRLLAPLSHPDRYFTAKGSAARVPGVTSHRVVIALGGNAMTGPDGSATPEAQRDAIREAAGHIADVVAAGVEVVLTHGNGPQVGNLLVKNEMAAHVVPPVPLDWNVAQTQATIAFTLADELDAALRGPRPPPAHRRPGHPHARRRRRPGLPRAVQAGRPLPPARGGGTVRLARPDLGGPRRARLAPGRRQPRAEVRRRLPRDPRAGRGRLRRRLRRGRRHPGHRRRPGRRASCAASRPSSTRT